MQYRKHTIDSALTPAAGRRPSIPVRAERDPKSVVGGRQLAQRGGGRELISSRQVVLDGAKQPRLHLSDFGGAVVAGPAQPERGVGEPTSSHPYREMGQVAMRLFVETRGDETGDVL